MRAECKNPHGAGATATAGKIRSTPDSRPRPRQRQGCFVPPRLSRALPPFNDLADVSFAVTLRGAIRRNIARGRSDAAAMFAVLAAELVRRQVGRGTA